MKRRNWWMALFAPQLVGQEQSTVMTQAEEYLASFDNVMGQSIRRRLKPANNQCPVCGTMAKPFTVPKAEKCYHFVSNMPSFRTPVTDIPACLPEWKLISISSAQNLVRCSHCSNSFVQDAE
jgi:hypothetical protein